MSINLKEVLALVGRLDDAPGFDSPRERFRRFLQERVTDAATGRSLVEQCQRSLGEQHHRVLQDAVVTLGRFLGFETTFGVYQRTEDSPKTDGVWRSHHRLDMALDIRTDQTSRTDVEDLSRALLQFSGPSHIQNDVRHLGLCIVSPFYASRPRLEEALLAEPAQKDLRIVSLRSLLWLADAVAAGQLTHDDVVQLLTSGIHLDFVVGLMGRVAAGETRDARSPRALPQVVPSLAPASGPPGYWIARIDADEATTAEQFVESVIGRRQLFGISGETGTTELRARPGDWLCFSVRDKGVVGHAQVEAIAGGTDLIRGARRFKMVCRLKSVDVYDAPVPFRRAEPPDQPSLASVAREEFSALTGGAVELGLRALRQNR